MKYGYVVVEGPHDVELVYRLLSPFGLKRIKLESDLDPFLKPLIPRSYPPNGDLQKRMPIPLFLQNTTHALAVHSAQGDSRLCQSVEETAALLGQGTLVGIGVVLDADSESLPVERYEEIRGQLRLKGFLFPDHPGEVASGQPRLGAFVLPDNQNKGTLEDVLLRCAQHVYSTLLATSTTHVDEAMRASSLTKDDLSELRKSAGRKKAIVGSIASVLRPGRAVQVSFQDNRWLRGDALELPQVQPIQAFLKDLLEIS